MDKNWERFIKEESDKGYYKELMNFLDGEYRENRVYPEKSLIFNALELTPFLNVKCVIVGQDPYINQGEAQGLAFSVPDSIKRPPSLKNILKELEDDLGIIREGNDLTPWALEGVLLLNRVLTVREGVSKSHSGVGWENFTREVINLLSNRDEPMVFILWGGDAQKIETLIKSHHFIIKSPHPSPLSAYRGFFNSKPFSKCNDFLKKKGINPIDWGRDE